MFSKAAFDQHLENFPAKIMAREELPNLYMWDAQQYFAKSWDIERLDFDSMYADSLHSNISNRLWTGIDYHPKESMMILLRYEKEFIRSMFRDLFNEGKDLQMRISRFIFHCDELLKQIKKKESKLLHHYHDEKMVVTYLALQDPKRYVFLDLDAFRASMISMQAKNIPEYITIESYTKLMRIIQKFINQDPSLSNGYRTLFSDLKLYIGESMLLALDFIQSTTT